MEHFKIFVIDLCILVVPGLINGKAQESNKNRRKVRKRL